MLDLHNDYVEGVASENVGFAQTTTLELLNHQDNSYRTINTSEVENNINAMVTPYAPSNTITILFVKIEKEVQI